MSKPCCGYPSVTAAVRAFLAEGYSAKEIAQKTGRSVEHVCSAARKVGLQASKPTGPKYGPLIDAVSLLREHADKRGVTPHMLAKRILIAAVDGDLIDAILGNYIRN